MGGPDFLTTRPAGCAAAGGGRVGATARVALTRAGFACVATASRPACFESAFACAFACFKAFSSLTALNRASFVVGALAAALGALAAPLAFTAVLGSGFPVFSARIRWYASWYTESYVDLYTSAFLSRAASETNGRFADEGSVPTIAAGGAAAWAMLRSAVGTATSSTAAASEAS